MSYIAHLIWFLIKGFRPLLGPAHCKYPVSCTVYAHEQLQTHSVLIAVKRLLYGYFLVTPLQANSWYAILILLNLGVVK